MGRGLCRSPEGPALVLSVGVLHEPRTGLPGREVGWFPLVMEGVVGILHASSWGRGVSGVGGLPSRCGDAGRVSPSCPMARLGTRATRHPIIAPECPRSAWVFPQPCPKQWRGPGRRLGRLWNKRRVSGGQTMLLMAVKGWVPHLKAKHPGFGGPWESSPCASAETSPFISRIMSSNIWLWIRP